jgi:tRNA threonylcarbamoyladenosine biosynthesis protein TsaE
MQKIILTKSEKETLRLGRLLGRHLEKTDILALIGGLGSGKTVLVKGIAQGLGLGEAGPLVNSPSFVLIKEYPGRINLFHFDLYRLDSLKEIEQLGWQEYLDKEGVVAIEWADKMGGLLPQGCLHIELEIISETERKIKLVSQGERYKKLISVLE